MTIHSAEVDLTTYKFFDFVDTIQVSETKSNLGPQQFDCIQTCDSNKVESAAQLNSLTDNHILTFLHRPFGRPNTIINDDRGWLFLERITIAIKAAAAEQSQFDDIVVSNSKKLRIQIYKWSERLRDAASKQKNEPRALSDLLNHFDDVLKTKLFSFSSDEDVVRGLMKKLVNQFANDWKGEVEKQKSMGKRAREILLRWGCFSEDYVERAGFLESGDRTLNWSQTMLRLVCIGMVAPLLAMLLFTFEVTTDPSEDEFIRSLWFGLVTALVPVLFGAPFRNEFAQIPYGKHNVLCILALAVDHALVSCTFMCLNVSLLLVSNSHIIAQFSFEPYLEFQLFPWSTFV